MSRVKIEMPEYFSFTTKIPVRITDVNYGGHVGNDSILSILHEARLQYLQQFGYSEMNMEGAGIIMADVAIEFKMEAFYGDVLIASVTAGNFQRAGFDLYYRIEKTAGEKMITIANAKTGLICYDYTRKKICAIPETAVKMLS